MIMWHLKSNGINNRTYGVTKSFAIESVGLSQGSLCRDRLWGVGMRTGSQNKSTPVAEPEASGQG